MAEQMKSVVVKRFGGPDVYERLQVPRPLPAEGQALIAVRIAGVNYLDVAQRSGTTPLRPCFSAGVEGVGTVAEIGANALGISQGQRVGWFTGGQGSFSDFTVVETSKLVAIPDHIDDDTAVAAMMHGVTAHYLTTDTFPVGAGDIVLVHAAAGGVGQMLTQIAKLKGATVIGTVSTPAKARIAETNGADHVIGYERFAQKVRDLTHGRGASVVYDGVGATTFEGSLYSLGIRGILALFGAASGPVPPLDLDSLKAGGSLYVTRPTVVDHVRTPEELAGRAADVFRWISEGPLSVSIGARYPLAKVSSAFADLESRRTSGKLVLEH